MIFGVATMTPNALNVSYSIFSSTSGSRLPMNKLAPTSRAFFSWEALLTRTGFPWTLIMFSTFIACTHCALVAVSHTGLSLSSCLLSLYLSYLSGHNWLADRLA